MRDSIDFCLYILEKIVYALFSLEIGGYSFGDAMVAIIVVTVFISSLVISFRRVGTSAGSAASSSVSQAGRDRFSPRTKSAGKSSGK